jgi:hypothetical protein
MSKFDKLYEDIISENKSEMKKLQQKMIKALEKLRKYEVEHSSYWDDSFQINLENFDYDYETDSRAEVGFTITDAGVEVMIELRSPTDKFEVIKHETYTTSYDKIAKDIVKTLKRKI